MILDGDRASLEHPAAAELGGGAPAVVAVVLEFRGRVALLKRGRENLEDHATWHWIVGPCESGLSPSFRAMECLFLQTGLSVTSLTSWDMGKPFHVDEGGGRQSVVYPFRASSSQRRLVLGEEHDSYRWTTRSRVARFSGRIPWVDDVLAAVEAIGPSTSIGGEGCGEA